MEIIKTYSLDEINYPVTSNLKSSDNISKIYANQIHNYLKENNFLSSTGVVILLCRGSSGAVMASLTYNHLKELIHNYIKIKHIKKPGENSHEFQNNFDLKESNKFFIVDDFIDSGETINAISNYFLHNVTNLKIDGILTGDRTPKIDKIKNQEHINFYNILTNECLEIVK